MFQRQYTPYEDVNQILDLLLKEVKNVLVREFIGMYLFGSLANGNFDQDSDIDILIVTTNELTQESFIALSMMHEEITKLDSPWAIQMEVSYMPQDALRKYDPANNVHPCLDRGNDEKLHQKLHANDWIIQRDVLRKCGVVIAGPDPKDLIDPILPGELQRAVADVLPLWINPMIADPSKINRRGYQSFFVLSVCRILYTLKHGEIISKTVAAQWGMENLDIKWRPLIAHAISGRHNAGMQAQPEDILGTIEMMKYTLEQVSPTPYPDVNEVLILLLTNVKEILKDQFFGMYLYGSLSSGDFNPETSDVDFLVVTQEVLSEELIAQLDAMHQRTWATSLKRAGKLEGAYIYSELIRKHDPNGQACPTINEGKFYLDRPGSDWVIQRHIVRESGIILEGPDPKTFIDPVTPQDIRSCVMGVLKEWWFPMLEDPAWLRNKEDGDRAFAVITMCRVMHALETGTIVSKPKAIQWARTKLDSHWNQLIDKAVAVSEHQEQKIDLDQTLDFIRYTKAQIEGKPS